MSRFYHTILCLATVALLASCQLIYDDEVIEDTSDKKPVTFVLQTRAGVEINPIVQSVRLFIFQNGVCMANRLFSSSDFTVSRNAEDSGTCDVAVNEEFTLKAGSKYDLYAVMNESGYMSTLAEGDGTLAAKLASVSEGKMNYREFLDILDTKLAYDPTTALDTDEQPFVMLSYIKDYTFTPNPAALATPVIVRMTDEGSAPRPMALLHLDKITSEAPAGETATDLDLTSKVFVLDVKLVNVPDGYYFNAASAGDGTTPTLSDIQIGSPGTDGYYGRDWWGTFSQTVTAKLSWREIVEGYAFFRVLSNNGNGCWKFTTIDNVTLTYSNMYDPYRYQANNGNLAQVIIDNINNFFETHTVEPILFLDEVTVVKSEMSDDCSWSIPLDYKIYIPENLSTNTSGSTGFLVKLALADDPQLDLSGLPLDFWNSSDTHWASNKVFYSWDQEMNWTGSSNSFLTKYAKSCWANDATKIDVTGSPNGYKFFVGGLSRVQTGTYGPKTLTVNSHESLSCEWDVPTSGTKVMEVFVPINNNNPEIRPDANDDYSVRRNQRYNVTLHVMKSTYDNLATRATDGSTIPVTVKATIDKVTEDQ